ncbi:hypothetical protein [Dickeya dadantii]|uniref:hypothetical protein n=1 Tax=Dickeya dadantii TaxID=204038 RepID=UPI00131F26AA|nr:hypothetical protein [Dickeya dadantii]
MALVRPVIGLKTKTPDLRLEKAGGVELARSGLTHAERSPCGPPAAVQNGRPFCRTLSGILVRPIIGLKTKTPDLRLEKAGGVELARSGLTCAWRSPCGPPAAVQNGGPFCRALSRILVRPVIGLKTKTPDLRLEKGG